jgi:hypothetical protein
MRILSITLLCLLSGCANEVQTIEKTSAAQTTDVAPKSDGQKAEITDHRFQPIAKEFPTGKLEKNILTVHIPRSDIEVGHIDLGQIPTAAGLHSTIYFFPCPCGKMSASGQLAAADYELNEVIDELRAARIKIASISPMFLGARPQIMLIRFHAEGDSAKLASALKKALSWMGEDRNTVPQE